MSIFDIFRKKRILPKIERKNKIVRIVIYTICLFLVTLSYNVFFVPNEIVMGGMSGLAIVIKKATGLNTSLFLLLSTAILLLISYIFLGRKETSKNFICAILFPIAVSITEPISKLLYIRFDSFMFTCLVAVITYSIPLGIIYKIGYSTGGGDIINQIICKFAKTSVGQASNYINLTIIATSIFIIGLPKTVYAVFTLLVNAKIVDFIILNNIIFLVQCPELASHL